MLPSSRVASATSSASTETGTEGSAPAATDDLSVTGSAGAARVLYIGVLSISEPWGGRDVTPETAIPGYSYASDDVARSPVSSDDLDLLKQTVLFGPQDEEALRLAGEVLEDQVEQLLDVWYGFVAS